MKRIDLSPSDENIKSTFLNDTINRHIDLLSFISIINSVEDSFSIALNSPWGSGKTFFVKQVKMIFDNKNDFLKVNKEQDVVEKWDKWASAYKNQYVNCDALKPHVTVYYDAWMNDNDDDPILSLMYQILSESQDFGALKDENDVSKLKGLLCSIIKNFTKSNINEVMEELKSEDPLKALKNKKELKQRISEYLDNLLPERGDRLLIIIDELDRCNPQFAVKLLEQIKHYFDNDRITFVFSVNLSELEHTIRKLYGYEFDSGRYLDRFFDLRITLPKAVDPKERLLSDREIFDTVVKRLINKYDMQMREEGKFIPAVKNACHNYAYASLINKNNIVHCISVYFLIPIALALKTVKPTQYQSLISGKDPKEFVDFICERMNIISYYKVINLILDNESQIMNLNGEIQYDISKLKTQITEYYYEFFNPDSHARNRIYEIIGSDRKFFYERINPIYYQN